MVLVSIDGMYYFIDPYSGTAYGPYATQRDAHDVANAIATQDGMLCQGLEARDRAAHMASARAARPDRAEALVEVGRLGCSGSLATVGGRGLGTTY